MTTKKLRPRAGNGKGASYDEARAHAKARKKARELTELRKSIAKLFPHLVFDDALAIVESVCQEHAVTCDAADPFLSEVGAMVARGRRALHRRAMVAMHEPAAEVRADLLDSRIRPRIIAGACAVRLVAALLANGVPMKRRNAEHAAKALELELEERAARDRVPDVDRLVALALEACGWSSKAAEVLSRAVPLNTLATPSPSEPTKVP